jgi:hypothetical protein
VPLPQGKLRFDSVGGSKSEFTTERSNRMNTLLQIWETMKSINAAYDKFMFRIMSCHPKLENAYKTWRIMYWVISFCSMPYIYTQIRDTIDSTTFLGFMKLVGEVLIGGFVVSFPSVSFCTNPYPNYDLKLLQ